MKNRKINFCGIAFDYNKFVILNDYFGFKSDHKKYYRLLSNFHNSYKRKYINNKIFIDYLLSSFNYKYEFFFYDNICKLFYKKNKLNYLIHSNLMLSEIDSKNIFAKNRDKNLISIIFLFIFELSITPLSLIFIFYKYLFFLLSSFNKKSLSINTTKVIIIGGANGVGHVLSNLIADYGFSITVYSKDKSKIDQITNIQSKYNLDFNLKYVPTDLLSKTNLEFNILKECEGFKSIIYIFNSAIKSKSLTESNIVNYEVGIKVSNYLNDNLKNRNIKHVFMSSYGKNSESIYFPYYNSSKASLSSIVRSNILKYSFNKNINYLLVEPGLIKTKLIKSNFLINIFAISKKKAAYVLFKSIFFKETNYLILGKRFLIISFILKILPQKFKFYILKKNSSTNET